MIRRQITDELLESAKEYPVVTLFGPRQSGKTTLARMTFPQKTYFSLEEPDTRLAAETDPRGFLNNVPEGAILDEIQRAPQLLSYIQGIVDKTNMPGMFLLTGSHQPELHQSVSQTLAGRTAVLTLLPFSLSELKNYKSEWDPFDIISQGAYPRIHNEGLNPTRFFNGYVQTYIERDVRALINLKELRTFQQFFILLAGRVGQIVNYSALANDVGVSATTIKNWISVLKASFVVFELSPFHENIRKRVVKSPKLYFTDVGLAAFLLNIETSDQAARDPLRGGLYENLILQEVLKESLNKGDRPDIFFFRDTLGNEVDLIIRKGRTVIPIEIKSAETFSADFLKGINRFRQLVKAKSTAGCVLYNGRDDYTLKETQIFNPMIHGFSSLVS